MLSIKSNIMAEASARHLGRSYEALSTSVERLSSGLRINGAKDDAAGLAVRELIRADIATLRQGARNAADAISMLQTAEGAMGEIDANLVRMKELAEQAATGSYSNTQRGLMNQEFSQLAKEISRIAETTDFNGIKLLNSTSSYEIHVGSTDATTPNKISIQAAKMDAGTLALSASKEYAIFGSGVASSSSDYMTVTTNGDLSFTFGGDLDDDGNAIGAVTVTGLATDGSADADAAYTLDELVDLINVASQAKQTGYNMASVHYDSATQTYKLKVSSYEGGDKTDLVAAAVGGLVTTEGIETSGNYDDVNGNGTGASIATQAGAITALDTVDSAITTKDTYRAKLGYMMNRLQAAANVVTIQAENLSAAESRISDVDVATEMAAMTRNQVLAQAGISMLAQANTMPQMALKLLG